MTNEEMIKAMFPEIKVERNGYLTRVVAQQFSFIVETDWLDAPYENKTSIKALEQQPCEDCISREAVLDKKQLVELEDGQSFYCISPEDVKTLPSVIPKASEQQPMHGYKIDFFTPTAQAWLSTFNTESATECFTAVQELKKRLEGDADANNN